MRSPIGTVARLVGRCLPFIAWAVLAPAALADAGPHMSTTNSGATVLTADTCAGCHRAHTARSEALVRTPDAVSLCITCHGSPAVGATTNVLDGILAPTVSGLKSGGFTNARMDTIWAGPPSSRPATSAHVTDGSTSVVMWGNGAIGSGAGKTVTLDCTSCHNPHGNGQYRVLRPIPTGSDAAAAVTIADEAPKVYTVASANNRYFGEIYFGGNLLTQQALENYCVSCHTRFSNPLPGGGHVPSADPIFTWRHRSGIEQPGVDCALCHFGSGPPNPFDIAGEEFAHNATCQNCHVSHGTAAQMGTVSGAVTLDHGTGTGGGTNSYLLRLDNRMICVGCHNQSQ